MAYAVISDRGRQYTVKAGDRLRVHSLPGAPGDAVVFDQVLLVGGEGSAKAGAPTVPGASVQGVVVRQGRAKKVVVFKIRRRKGYRRKQGHRQGFTEVRIESVNAR